MYGHIPVDLGEFSRLSPIISKTDLSHFDLLYNNILKYMKFIDIPNPLFNYGIKLDICIAIVCRYFTDILCFNWNIADVLLENNVVQMSLYNSQNNCQTLQYKTTNPNSPYRLHARQASMWISLGFVAFRCFKSSDMDTKFTFKC